MDAKSQAVLEFESPLKVFHPVMRARRFTFVIADRHTGAVRRFTLSLWPSLAAVVGVFSLPVLMGLGARWSAAATIQDLQATNAALHIESAMDKLPAIVKSRAMGGESRAALGPMIAGGTGPTETALGVLSELLGVIGNRLDSVRDSGERRHALAAATPSVWPVAGWLSSSYGTRKDPFTHGADFHPGLDISADYGVPVLATADATVSTAGANGAYGNMVTLDHGFGIVTKYGHMSRIAVSANQHVRRGDVIGYVGSTGRSTGAHLHYEIWMNGRLPNPMTLLAH